MWLTIETECLALYACLFQLVPTDGTQFVPKQSRVLPTGSQLHPHQFEPRLLAGQFVDTTTSAATLDMVVLFDNRKGNVDLFRLGILFGVFPIITPPPPPPA